MRQTVNQPKVCIVGKNKLQSELLSFCLEKELNIKTFVYQTDILPTILPPVNHQPYTVLLIDCRSNDAGEVAQKLRQAPTNLPFHRFIVLFNVEPGCNLDHLIKPDKIRGLFCRTDSSEIFIKGMAHILKGRLWLPRKTLSNCILNHASHSTLSFTCYADLSDREKIILQHVASGARNQDIANKLKISVHTVKTHLYKIYRKINVPNRLQATRWVKMTQPLVSEWYPKS